MYERTATQEQDVCRVFNYQPNCTLCEMYSIEAHSLFGTVFYNPLGSSDKSSFCLLRWRWPENLCLFVGNTCKLFWECMWELVYTVKLVLCT